MDPKVLKIITEEITKSEISHLANDEDVKLLKSKEFEKRVKEISAKVVEELYKILWQRKSFWVDSINK